MDIWFVRHAQTTANASGTCQGQSEWPLNDIGKEEAFQTGFRLFKHRFKEIWCCDLERSRHTVQGILAENLVQEVPTTFDKILRGQFSGTQEGKPTKEIYEMMAKFEGVRRDFRIPGGEANSEICNRALTFLRDIYARRIGKSRERSEEWDVFEQYLVGTHGRFIMSMYEILGDYDGVERPEAFKESANCSLHNMRLYCKETGGFCREDCPSNTNGKDLGCMKWDIVLNGDVTHLTDE